MEQDEAESKRQQAIEEVVKQQKAGQKEQSVCSTKNSEKKL